LVPASISVDYRKSWDQFWFDMKFIFFSLNLMPLIVFGIRMSSWLAKNPQNLFSDPAKYTKAMGLKATFFFLDSFSQFNFWFIYFTSMWIYVTYKMQENAYMVLPSLSDVDSIY